MEPAGVRQGGHEASPQHLEATGEEFTEPLHLLRPSEDHGSLVANPAAMNRLRAMGSVTVLSIVGNQRGGKSTLMNLLHSRRLRGFQVAHYMDPQTHGIWVWPKPHPRRAGVTVLLVDSEGLDSPHTPHHYNWLVSAITLLMSDVYMYQTKGSIEQSSAERLDMILKVAEQLGRAAASDGEAAEAMGGAFLWLLRDHQLQMKHSPKQELVEKLDPSQVRALRRTFGDYDCVPLPRPAGDAILRQLDKHSFQELAEEFQEEFVVLERRLLDQLAKPRRLFGGDLTGASLAELLQQYLAAISQRKGCMADICEMPTQRQMLQQLAGKRALEAGVKAYEAGLVHAGLRGASAKLPVTPSELFAGHETARSSAIEALDAEVAAAGLEAEEAAAVHLRLEERLASWGTQMCINGGSARDVAPDEDVNPLAPMVSRNNMLVGGFLFELWQDNARRSWTAYQRWQQRVAGVREDVWQAWRSNPAEMREPLQSLESYYSHVHDILGEARDSGGGRLGPWVAWAGGEPAEGGGEQPWRVLLNALEQGDGLVLALADAAANRTVSVMQARLDAQQQDFCDGLGAVKASLGGLEEQVERQVVEVREVTQQAKEKLQQELMSARSTTTEALQELQASVDRKLTELHASLEHRFAEVLKASEVHVQQSVAELGNALEAAKAMSEASLRSAQQVQQEELQQTVETSEARLSARLLELQAAFEQLCHQEVAALSSQLQESSVTTASRLTDIEHIVADTRTDGESRWLMLQATDEQLQAALGSLDSRLLGACTDLDKKLTDHSEATQAQLGRASAEAASLHSESELTWERQAGNLQGSVQRLEQRCSQELKNQEQRVELHCRDVAEDLVVGGLERALGAYEENEAQRFQNRLMPLMQEQRKANEVMLQRDPQALWESISHLASRLSEMQSVVDNLVLTSAGLRGIS